MEFGKYIVLLALVFCLTIGKTHQSKFLQVGQSVTGFTSKETNFLSFQMIRVNQIQENYLFFIAAPVDEGDRQNFMISVYPVGKDNHIIECSSQGLDTCFLENNMIQQNTDYVVQIDCQHECSYTFTTKWGDIKYLEINDSLNFYFSEKGQAEIYKVKLGETQFDELKILLGPKSRKTEDDFVKIYGCFGQDVQPTQQKYDFVSQSLWGGIEVVFLEKENIKSDKLTLLIVGQSSIIYSLNIEAVNGTSHSFYEGQKEIMQLDAGETQYINFRLNKSSTKDQFIFGFSFMNGMGAITFYSDENFTIPYDIPFINYMQDYEYFIDSKEIQKLASDRLYAKVQAKQKDTVFMVKHQLRDIQTPVELIENIYEFIPIENQKLGFLYFDIRNFQSDYNAVQNDSEIDLAIVKAAGQYQLSFRICTVHFTLCTDPNRYKEASEPIAVVNQGSVGIKTHYKISIKQEQLMPVSTYQKRGILLMQFRNLLNKTTVLAGQYSYSSAIQDLRLSHPLEQIIQKGDQKIYKYTNSDSAVESVRFHINEIKGAVQTKIYKENPLKGNTHKLKQINTDDAVDTKKLYHPLYLVVKAKELSIVGISVQQINDKQMITSLSLTESIPYTLRIQPRGEQSLKLNPLYESVNLNFKATGAILICQLSKQEKCKQKHPLYAKQGSLQFIRQEDENLLLIVNPNQDKFIQVTITYRSVTGSSCDIVQIGQIYQENVASGSCFSFLLDTIQTNLLMHAERLDIGPFQTQAQVCGIVLSQQVENLAQISKEQLDKYCKNTPSADRKLILRVQNNEKDKENSQPFKIQFHAEYENSIIQIPDGLAYRCGGKNSQGMLKKFFYKAINLIDTKILLKSFDGNLKIFGKIIDKDEKFSQDVNPQAYDFQTSANSLIRNQASVITADMFKQDSCQICSLLIAVYCDGDVGKNFDYSIEIVQNSVLLKDNTILQNVLQKGSVAFYEYTSVKTQNCNLIIETSDNNRQCTKIYLADSQNPSDSNNLVIENGNKLVYPNCHAQTYYIAVEAVESCSYGIQVSNSMHSLVKIERSKPVNIDLQENQVKFMIFRHISAQQFKIMAMNEYGSATIYATPFSSTLIQSIRAGQTVNLNDFQFKSVLKNSLLVKQTEKGFCSDCYYIGAIQAQNELKSTAILADRQSVTELDTKKILTDQLQQNTTSHFYFTKVLTGSLPIVVYEGEVEVSLKYPGQEIKETYSQAKQIRELKFDYSQEKQFEYTMNPITLDVSCKKSYCYYSIGLKDQTLYQRPMRRVSANPEYVYIKNTENACVNGYLEKEDSKIILSVSKLKKQTLKQISVSMKIQGVSVENVPTETYSNIMIITPKISTGKASSFQLCLSTDSQDFIFLIIQEGQNVKILPENEDTLSFNNSTFIVYPNGQLLIDVFDCTGDATFKYSTNQENFMNNENMTIFSQVAMPQQPHALKITSFLPTYLQIQGQKSIVRWMDFNLQDQQGVGYEKYQVGNARFTSQGDNLRIQWGSLKKKMQTKTNVKATSYTLFISSDQKLVKYASQCQVDSSKVLAYHIVNTNTTLDKQLSFTIPKADLENKFSKDANLFMIIAADLELAPPPKQTNGEQSELQFYRFFYSEQQIPSDIYKGNQRSAGVRMAIIATAISIVGLAVIGIAYIVIKKLVPLVSRMKNRVLLQEAVASETPPIQSNERIVVDLS